MGKKNKKKGRSGYDDEEFGGFGRIGHELRSAYVPGHDGPALMLGLPPRTAMVLRPVRK